MAASARETGEAGRAAGKVKWLRRIAVVDRPYLTRMDGVGQPTLTPDGKAGQLQFVMEAKSVITFPSGSQQLPGPGFYEIRGLAWSGRGLVRRVEVSVDGGKTSQTRGSRRPSSSAHTRFRLDWRWDGRETVLQSRCTGETGYLQPTLAELVRVRGLNSIYFNSAIQSWKVRSTGASTISTRSLGRAARIGALIAIGGVSPGGGPAANLRRWPFAHRQRGQSQPPGPHRGRPPRLPRALVRAQAARYFSRDGYTTMKFDWFGILTFDKVCAFISSFSPMIPLRLSRYAVTAYTSSLLSECGCV